MQNTYITTDLDIVYTSTHIYMKNTQFDLLVWVELMLAQIHPAVQFLRGKGELG